MENRIPFDAAIVSVTHEIQELWKQYLDVLNANTKLRGELRFYQDKMAELAYENISLKNELAEAKVKAEGTHNTRVSDERRREIEEETIFQLKGKLKLSAERIEKLARDHVSLRIESDALKLKAERLDQIEKLFASFSADPRKGAK